MAGVIYTLLRICIKLRHKIGCVKVWRLMKKNKKNCLW